MISSVFHYLQNQEVHSPSLYDVVREDLATFDGFWSVIVRPYAQGIKWSKFNLTPLPEPLRRTKYLIKMAGLAKSAFDRPKKIRKIPQYMNEWWNSLFEGASLEAASVTVDLYAGLLQPFSFARDIAKLGRGLGVITLSEKATSVFPLLGRVGSVSFFLTSAKEVWQRSSDFIYEEIDSVKFKFATLELVNKTSTFASSFFGLMRTLSTGIVASQWTLLCLSTVALLFSIIARYYKKLYIDQ